eukprot:2200914-Prymnesium_polylepis.1
MREFMRAVVTKQPMISLIELEAKKGGITREEVERHLSHNDLGFYRKCGLEAEVLEWGFAIPTADELFTALFAKEPIQWNRIGFFQDVSMRLIANHVIKPGGGGTLADEECGVGQPRSSTKSGIELPDDTYLQGEVSMMQPKVGPPQRGHAFHVYCSEHNEGAAALMAE